MRFSRFGSIATVLLALAASAPLAAAATEQVLYSFKDACCGYPQGRLHFMSGHLFGTGSACYGGTCQYGQVFELTNSGGVWTESSPLLFKGTDGYQPVAGLISDSSSFLFGTTRVGDAYGYGNVFILYKAGSWIHGTVWAFGGTSGDGQSPDCDLIMDSSGNLYGTTEVGGAYGKGTAFELTPYFSGWTETVLHSFNGSDGANPYAGLLMDSSGAFYGTTVNGGAFGYGTAFKLTQSGGVWSETVLHSFGNGSDGQNPDGVLIRDTKGRLYGTTSTDGGVGAGKVFELFTSGSVWKEKVLYTFPGGGGDASQPVGGLRWGGTGVLYGTTIAGGTSNKGAVFALTQSGGVWTESVLHSFGSGTDGVNPKDQVVLDKSGNLYGTTVAGGKYGYGTVWEVVP